jgi:hypothetical protein
MLSCREHCCEQAVTYSELIVLYPANSQRLTVFENVAVLLAFKANAVLTLIQRCI